MNLYHGLFVYRHVNRYHGLFVYRPSYMVFRPCGVMSCYILCDDGEWRYAFSELT